MPLEELKKDAEELSKLLNIATRRKVLDVLTQTKAEVDKQITILEIKALQEADNTLKGEKPSPKRYICELNEYAWDQSEKYVKLFVTLKGVQNIPELQVEAKYSEKSVELLVSDINGKDYGLTINNLLESIDVEKSYRKVKTDLIAIYLKKVSESNHWDHLTTIHKRLKDKEDTNLKKESESNPENALVNVMKKMYNSGDSKTKQMIAKAWTESQHKMHSGNPMEP